MKKTLFPMLFIIVFVVLIIYVFLHPPGSCAKPEQTATTICSDYSKYSPSTLKAFLIKDMITNYKKKQLSSIRGASVNPIANDAHSIWFNMDTLKKFIYDIEHISKQNGVTDPKRLGVRIYYAAYPERSLWSNPGYEELSNFISDPEKSNYGKLHTLVMIPTLKNTDGKNYDFNPVDMETVQSGGINRLNNENQESPQFQQFLKYRNPSPSDSGVRQMSISGSSQGIARNHGQLIPPGDPAVEAY